MSEDRFPLSQSHGNAERRGKFKAKGQADTEVRDCEKGKVRDTDELVKYMLNPPGYLQRTERRENFRGKALSFGVLDWERLEKFKHYADGTKGTLFSDASSSGFVTNSEETAFTSLSCSSSISENTHGYGEEKQFCSCSGASLPHKDEHFRYYESACRGKWVEKNSIWWNADSLDRDYSDLSAGLMKRLELDQGFSFRSSENANAVDAGSRKITEERVTVNVTKKMFDKSSTLCSASPSSSKEDLPIRMQQKMSSRTTERKKKGITELDVSHQSRHNLPADIILLRSNKYGPKNHVEKHQITHKNLVEEMQGDISTEFLPQKDNSSELKSTVPHSCPLLFSHQTYPGSETTSNPLSEAAKKVECQNNKRDVEGECSHLVDLEYGIRNGAEKQCLLDQEMPEAASRKGRYASPNRRFSFSFGQMRRSFSFKESSSVPVSSSPVHDSAKSGPLTSGGSGYRKGSTWMNHSSHNRTKSSPLRRMMDPLLKPKTKRQVAAVASNPRPTVNQSSEKEKNQESLTEHALLQFTERKGVHLFQFVVDNNNNNVLAATMKSSDSSSRFYTFYSVKEVKKKSGGWLGQGNKEKSNGFAYKIIGHVRTLTSFTTDFMTQKSESVLFDVETNPEDGSMANAERAAIISETHHRSEDKEESHSTTVILPAGVHTLPKDSNALLPLIDRWKSGGTCDCGGWDLGCKLRILSDRRPHHLSKSSKALPNRPNRLQLFDQESERPKLTIASLGDGLHSVEFDVSVSLLEAFFISLTVSSHEKAPLVIVQGRVKTEPPVKYASNPPVSPVGRV